MGEENQKTIPVLDDVVELGHGLTSQIDSQTGEENIRIIADQTLASEFDDPYDDEFKKLFDNATDVGTEPDPAQLSIEDIETSEHETLAHDQPITEPLSDPGDTAEQPVPDLATTEEVALDVDTDKSPTAQTDDDDLWLSEWQEQTAANNLIAQADPSTDDPLDILHTKAEIEITDEETAALIAAAVEEDDIPPEVTATRDAAAPVETTEAMQPATEPAATPTRVNTSALVDQIVTELLPEIEWKLRTKVREVLEQHFPPEDE